MIEVVISGNASHALPNNENWEAGHSPYSSNLLNSPARPERFERPTLRFVVRTPAYHRRRHVHEVAIEPSSTRQPSRAGGQLPVLDYERRWPYGCNRPSISYSRFGEEVLHL